MVGKAIAKELPKSGIGGVEVHNRHQCPLFGKPLQASETLLSSHPLMLHIFLERVTNSCPEFTKLAIFGGLEVAFHKSLYIFYSHFLIS